MTARNMNSIVMASSIPIDAEQQQQQQQLHACTTSSSSPGTSPMSATRLRHSPGVAVPTSSQSPMSVHIPVGGGGTHSGFPGLSLGYVPSADVVQSSMMVPAMELAARQYTQQQFCADAIRGRSPTNYRAAGGMAGFRPMPALSVERLGEPVLMSGPPGTAACAAMAMNFVTPLSGVLDSPSTPPSSAATPANTNFSMSEYPGLISTSSAPTPVTPTEHSSTNLILYNIGPHMTEVALHTLFDPFGEVVSCAVMRDIHTGAGLGTAFVRYSEHMDACRALEAFGDRTNPVCVHEAKPLVVQWARKQHDGAPAGEARKKIMKLFVRNVPLDCTRTDLEELFGAFGSVRQVTLHKDTSPVQDEAMVRLIAFVIYTEEGAAERAAREVHNTKPFASCNGIPIMIKLAESSQRRRFMKNAEATGPILSVTGLIGFPAVRTSPMMPGVSSSPFDIAAAAQHHQHLQPHQQHPAVSQQGMFETHGFETSPSSYIMPVFDGSAAYAAPDPREASTGSHQGTSQRLQMSVSGGGTPACVTPLASNIIGGSPSRHHQPIPTYAGDREGRVSPHSSSVSAPMLAHSYRQAASLSFDANAVAAYGGLLTPSKLNDQNLPDGTAGAGSAGGCPSGSFLYFSSRPSDGKFTAATDASNGGSPQVPVSGPWCETTGVDTNQSINLSASTQLTRKHMEANCSPPVAGSAPPPGPLRLGSTPSMVFSSAHGSPQQSTGPQRTSPTSMTAPGVVATNRPVCGAFVPIGVQTNVAPQLSTRLSVSSSGSISDMNSTPPSHNFCSGTTPITGATHNMESPTVRTGASESWRRAVRTHVHNTKRQNERFNVSGSPPSMPAISASCSALAPAASSPTAARKGSMLSISCNEASAPGTTPPTSPISISTLSADQAGAKPISTGTPSSGRMRYYNNPYSTESTKLFC
ncbi:putative RNA binding protein [Leishmania mexicana MHOM/GT/2001/U1103]|uniref:RNA binding protein n=1 Tax=Leishmania mexicana (strain MHOM/GT/2001/U1103) TaxID=929439 RepID=E9ALT7_LEIMU|nr:putative RNA binding protein [Leishmania mexicana MHOM/GT/2001/U1103]CBZ23892.1 putative RNA binding protein [Leishmania mexicana MHOM/GT/2001/U1103]